MPAELARIGLLDVLHKLRKGRRRVFSSFVTTYSINLSFYENVVLRHLEASGSRLNVVLADAGELAKAFANASTSPQRAGIDYVLIPVRASGAFHPKIIALFSEEGLSIALGSHNLTEAGLTRNGEISVTFGFERQLAPVNISVPVADYLIESAGELAPGDSRLSQRLATRLRQYASRGAESEADVAFVAGSADGRPLLDKVFSGRDLAYAQRILAMGPYFDDNLAFVRELKKRAPIAELVLAIQPSHTVLKFPARMPTGVQLRDTEVLPFDSPKPFVHGKAIVVESGGQTIVALGSANPSAPAWLADGDGNFEALAVVRGSAAKKIVSALALDQIWKAPEISKEQLKHIELRSRRDAEEEPPTPGILVFRGLWQDGFVTAQIGTAFRKIKEVKARIDGASGAATVEGISITKGVLRFAASEAGTFTVQTAERTETIIIVAASVRELSQTLVSSQTARLIDELGRLTGGAAPSEELLNLCDKILLSPGGKSEEPSASRSGSRAVRAQDQPSDSEAYTPRGIGVQDKSSKGRKLSIDLDFSAIITMLLKDLASLPKRKENDDPEARDDDEPKDEPFDEKGARSQPQWEDIVRGVKPRVTRILNRLSERMDEDRSATWKYERILFTLALMKNLRKYHPGDKIPFSRNPERLVDDVQLRDAFKLATRCLFGRDGGVFDALERMGGVESELEIAGRALLLWAAYETSADVAAPTNFYVDPAELKNWQTDRMDALACAMAASASQDTIERARRELFDRGQWTEPRDRRDKIEAWFRRHTQVGQALQRALQSSRPSRLPVVQQPVTIQDIIVWKEEPAWPRLPIVVTAKIVHLTDVGAEDPVKITRQFAQAVDLEKLGIAKLVAPLR